MTFYAIFGCTFFNFKLWVSHITCDSPFEEIVFSPISVENIHQEHVVSPVEGGAILANWTLKQTPKLSGLASTQLVFYVVEIFATLEKLENYVNSEAEL